MLIAPSTQSYTLHLQFFLPYRRFCIWATCLLALCFYLCQPAMAAVPIPKGVSLEGSPPFPPSQALLALLNMPYRADGAISETGQYCIFSTPQKTFTAPGLNCSGFVLEAYRLIFNKNISLTIASKDRLKDSSYNSPLGKDWDFGWDFLLNISEGQPRRLLLPNGNSIVPETATGLFPRGYDIHSPTTREQLLPRLRPGHLYLVSFSKAISAKDPRILHYHVGLIFPDKNGLWLYQTTNTGKKANRRNLSTNQGWQSFLTAFANTGGVYKYLLVLEVDLP